MLGNEIGRLKDLLATEADRSYAASADSQLLQSDLLKISTADSQLAIDTILYNKCLRHVDSLENKSAVADSVKKEYRFTQVFIAYKGNHPGALVLWVYMNKHFKIVLVRKPDSRETILE